MDVGRNAGDFQLPEDGGVGFVRHVDDPKGVDLFEGHDVGAVAVEPSRPNSFPGSDTIDLSGFNQHLALRFQINATCQRHELRRHGLGIVHPPSVPLTGGRGHPEDAFVFGHGKLIENGPVDTPRTGVQRRIGGADVERVKVGHLVSGVVAPKPPPVKRIFGEHQHVL